MIVLEQFAKGLLCINSAPLQLAQQEVRLGPGCCTPGMDQRLQGVFPGALEMVHLQAWEQGEVPQVCA